MKVLPAVLLVTGTAIFLGACALSSGSSESAAAESADTSDARKHAKADAGSENEAGANGGADAASPSGLSLLTEPDDGFSAIYQFMGAAKSTIDMTMYELVDPTVTAALVKAAKAGVAVRVILDQEVEKSTNSTAYSALAAGGVQVHWANPAFTVTHQKTITVDHAKSAVMTANLDARDYATTRDFVVFTTDANDVAAIESTFDGDFTNASITPPTGDDLVWSPTNSATSLLDIIQAAKSSLLIENEEMDDPTIISALISAVSRGVDVKVVMTDATSYSAEFKQLVSGGVKLATYASTASLYIHAKVIVADYGTSAASAFVGSENFSTTSLTKNRELGLIVRDSTVLGSLNGTLSSDYAGATPY